MPDGTDVQRPVGAPRRCCSRARGVRRTVTSKLLTYALGRGLEHYDMPAIRAIVRDAAAEDYRWSAVILGIVKSVPFQMRRSES